MAKRTSTRDGLQGQPDSGTPSHDKTDASRPAVQQTHVDAPALPEPEHPATQLNPLPEPLVPQRKPTRGQVPATPAPRDGKTEPSTTLTPLPEPEPPRPARRPTRGLVAATVPATTLTPALPEARPRKPTRGPIPASRDGDTAPDAPLPPALVADAAPRPVRRPTRGLVQAAPPPDATELRPALAPEPPATALIPLDAPARRDETGAVPVLNGVPRRSQPDPLWKVALAAVRDRWSALTPQQQLRVEIGGGVAVFVLASLLALGVLVRPHVAAQASQDGASGEAADQLLAAARLAVAERRYDEAVDLLEKAERSGPDSASVAQELAHARADRAAELLIQDARAALDRQRFSDARDALARIPDGTDLEVQKKLALAELDVAESKSLFDRASALIASGQGHDPQATAAIAQLAKIRPELAAGLQNQLKSAPSGSAEAVRPIARTPGDADDRELKEALDLFDREPAAGAAMLARVAGASRKPKVAQLARSLADAARRCADELQALHGEDLAALERADAACAQVVPSGRLTAGLESRRIAALNEDARAAALHEEWGRAARDYRGVLSIRPADRHAREELNRLLARAHELYLQGYVNAPRDPDGADHALVQALKILAPGDADYAKARAKLDEVRATAQ